MLPHKQPVLACAHVHQSNYHCNCNPVITRLLVIMLPIESSPYYDERDNSPSKRNIVTYPENCCRTRKAYHNSFGVQAGIMVSSSVSKFHSSCTVLGQDERSALWMRFNSSISAHCLHVTGRVIHEEFISPLLFLFTKQSL